MGRLAIKALSHRRGQPGKILFEARHHGQSEGIGGVQKRSGGVFAVAHYVIGKTGSQVVYGAPQQTLCGGIFAVSGAVRLYVQRQRQASSDHADHYKVM